MGWWWQSKSPDVQPEQQERQALPPMQQQQQQQQQQKPRALTADEQAEAELRQFFAGIEASEAGPSQSGQSQPGLLQPGPLPQSEQLQSGSSSQPSQSGSSQPGPLQAGPSSIAPEQLYPESMSCRAAFDYAFFCQSFGGQFVNVYRYGELRSCSEHWDNFWLCMRMRGYPDTAEHKKATIREHYRKKAVKYKTGPSSEDVWDMRMEPLRSAFSGDFAALEREIKMEEEAESL